jgi:hypothetical protein
MMQWLRRVTPDLFLAAVIALVVTLILNELDAIESQRIIAEVRFVAHDGLTVEERLGVFHRSIRRSIFLYQPVLIASAAVIVGFFCRNRGWAWLTAILAAIPAFLMGVSFVIDTPLPGAALLTTYLCISIFLSLAGVAIRTRVASMNAPASID